MSDADLEALMGGGQESASEGQADAEQLQSGDRVQGVVIGLQGDEVLVELDGKTLGVVDIKEFEAEDIPEVGDKVKAEYSHYDYKKEVCVLSTQTVRTEVTWEQLHTGAVIEGKVTDTNRGGLILDIKGIRAFMPVSQIDRQRTEELEPFIGKKLQAEVTRVDRQREEIVVSRRNILEREYEKQREAAFSKLVEGTRVKGKVQRINQHGAFIDVGGVDGLLHISRIQRMGKEEGNEEGPKLKEGQILEVEISRIDHERGRIGLDFVKKETQAAQTVEAPVHQIEVEDTPFETDYEVGESITGWVLRLEGDGATISIEEGVEAHVPKESIPAGWGTGTVINAVVSKIQDKAPNIWLEPR